MFILQKIEHGVAIDISAHDTLDRLISAVQHYTELHGVVPMKVVVNEDDELRDVCTAAVDVFTDEENNIVAFEELTELQKELCKRMRGAENNDHMAEEIADVEIVIEKLKIRYGLRERVDAWRHKKIDLLHRKIRGRTP